MVNEMLVGQGIVCSIAGTSILTGATFKINEGETVGLIGPNGCGKTTLFNCISGFSRIQEGTIKFKGREIQAEEPHTRAAHGIGRVFQNFGIFREMTVLENIVIALESKQPLIKTLLPWSSLYKKLKRQGMDFLDQVGLSDKANAKASSLSGGQMRLLEIVRLLAFGSQLLLLDEPTAGVSPKMKEQLAAIISRLKAENRTVLVIEHDINFIQRLCERVLVLDGGKVVLDDTPEKVRISPLLQELYFGKNGGNRAA